MTFGLKPLRAWAVVRPDGSVALSNPYEPFLIYPDEGGAIAESICGERTIAWRSD